VHRRADQSSEKVVFKPVYPLRVWRPRLARTMIVVEPFSDFFAAQSPPLSHSHPAK